MLSTVIFLAFGTLAIYRWEAIMLAVAWALVDQTPAGWLLIPVTLLVYTIARRRSALAAR